MKIGPLSRSVEQAVLELIDHLGVPYCVQITINIHEGRVSSLEARQKFQPNGEKKHDSPVRLDVQQ